MYRHQSIAQVVAELDLVLPDEVNPDIATSALTQARQRPGQEPFAQLLLCLPWLGIHAISAAKAGVAWLATPWMAAPCEPRIPQATVGTWAFGHLGTQEYASGLVASYPQMRMLTLTSLATHLLRDAVLGEYGKNVDAPCQRAD